jgi:hypothetical protein
MSDPIARLRAAVRESGSPLADSLGDEPEPEFDRDEPARIAAAGPRVAGGREEVELAVTAVREGYRLHYGRPRALAIDDPDLALLAGDRLYALGLARLAEFGDLIAIAELADIIALSAQSHAGGEDDLAAATWEAGATAIGWGPDQRIAVAHGPAMPVPARPSGRRRAPSVPAQARDICHDRL